MKFTISADDSLIEACCDFPDGSITIPLPKYQATSLVKSSPDDAGVEVANSLSESEWLCRWIGSVCDLLIQGKIDREADAAVIEADKKHTDEMNAMRAKIVEEMTAKIEKTVVSQ